MNSEKLIVNSVSLVIQVTIISTIHSSLLTIHSAVNSNNNLWQSPEWLKYQESLGREVRIYDGVQVVIDRTTGGYSTWEIIRSDVGHRTEDIDNLFEQIIEEAKKDKCFALYVSPENDPSDSGSPSRRGRSTTDRIPSLKFADSNRNIIPQATRVIDLTKSEDEILAQMKSKGRYNIKVAQKHGVTVEQSTDVDAFYNLIQKTSKRDGFKPLPKEQYEKFLNNLDGSFMLLAFPNATGTEPVLSLSKGGSRFRAPIAGLIGVIWNKIGIYYYGASSYEHRSLMAPYLLQWETMKYCKEKGCISYDLFGIAPIKEAPLSPRERGRGRGKDHPWKGVSEFKEKFGGEIVSYPGEQVIILRPFIYRLINIKRKLF